MKGLDIEFIQPGPDDEAAPRPPIRVHLVAADYVRLEAATKSRITEGVGYTDVIRLAFYALARTGQLPAGTAGYEEFVKAVDDVSPLDAADMEATDPLETGNTP